MLMPVFEKGRIVLVQPSFSEDLKCVSSGWSLYRAHGSATCSGTLSIFLHTFYLLKGAVSRDCWSPFYSWNELAWFTEYHMYTTIFSLKYTRFDLVGKTLISLIFENILASRAQNYVFYLLLNNSSDTRGDYQKWQVIL